MFHIDDASAGKTVDVPVGEFIELRLRENPTAGFHWLVQLSAKSVCQIKEDRLEPPAQPTPGLGGTHIWRIGTTQTGICDLSLSYGRAWEKNQPPARTFDVMINVTK